MINAMIDPPECAFSEQELDEAKRAIAQDSWDALDEDACEFLLDHAGDYVIRLARGGDIANAARLDMERDCVGYLAQYVPTQKAIRRLS